ncbi:hypothetical protein H2204_004078 [Knufia peltigerae]|uniref:Uncharacterized protein n=1 Tax=Knufia peltigerae TaxID=1002370 RepID=A0AA38Y9D6_9EURO|nr:hypothetical protein H2204_004078 [Knufia peltigerae]
MCVRLYVYSNLLLLRLESIYDKTRKRSKPPAGVDSSAKSLLGEFRNCNPYTYGSTTDDDSSSTSSNHSVLTSVGEDDILIEWEASGLGDELWPSLEDSHSISEHNSDLSASDALNIDNDDTMSLASTRDSPRAVTHGNELGDAEEDDNLLLAEEGMLPETRESLSFEGREHNEDATLSQEHAHPELSKFSP